MKHKIIFLLILLVLVIFITSVIEKNAQEREKSKNEGVNFDDDQRNGSFFPDREQPEKEGSLADGANDTIGGSGLSVGNTSTGNTGSSGGGSSGSSTKVKLSEFQTTACEAADSAGTCDTKLKNLGLVEKEDCCSVIGKCCD